MKAKKRMRPSLNDLQFGNAQSQPLFTVATEFDFRSRRFAVALQRQYRAFAKFIVKDLDANREAVAVRPWV